MDDWDVALLFGIQIAPGHFFVLFDYLVEIERGGHGYRRLTSSGPWLAYFS